MKRLTTETPKDNLEAALNLFYIKDHETWVRGGGPGPEYADVSLFDFIRDVAKTYVPDVELPEDNDDLSDMMPEWLMDGIDSAEGIVALLYTAAWAYAELRHKLMRYEEQAEQAEKLLAESETARAELGKRLAAAQKMNAELTDAQAVMVKEFDKKLEELAQVKAERDAAVRDLHGECSACEHVDTDCPAMNCRNGEKFKWRGTQKEGT